MIFTFLISIVFIAELIIAAAIFFQLRKLTKSVQNLNLTLNYLKPSIKEVCILARKISGQLVEITEDFVAKLKRKQEEIILGHLSRIILGTLVFRKFKKTKISKLISKGLSLLEIVV